MQDERVDERVDGEVVLLAGMACEAAAVVQVYRHSRIGVGRAGMVAAPELVDPRIDLDRVDALGAGAQSRRDIVSAPRADDHELSQHGEHAHGDLSLVTLLERCVCALRRVVAYGVLNRDALFGPPAADGQAVRALARDRRVETEVRVDRLDRPVRAEGDVYAVRHHRVPTVRAHHSVLAQTRLGPALVRDCVRRLHRGDDSEVSEAREVRRRDNLRVLDAVARPFDRALSPQLNLIILSLFLLGLWYIR